VCHRLQYVSKTGEGSRGLEGTPGEKKRRGNSRLFTQQKPKSCTIIGLGLTGEKGSISLAS
jgi:hypothetical protein